MPEILFLPDGWEDYLYCQGQDRRTLRRINAIIKGIQRNPSDGIGKPEQLKSKELLKNKLYKFSLRMGRCLA